MAIRPYGPYVPKEVTTLVECIKAELKEGFLSMQQLSTGLRKSTSGLSTSEKITSKTRVNLILRGNRGNAFIFAAAQQKTQANLAIN